MAISVGGGFNRSRIDVYRGVIPIHAVTSNRESGERQLSASHAIVAPSIAEGAGEPLLVAGIRGENLISTPSEKLKQAIKRTPVLSVISRFVYYRLIEPLRAFPGSDNYWKGRYAMGGTSGDGSYDALAEFKAEIINSLVTQQQVASAIEFGCGDGNQLRFSNYRQYLGVDISPEAVALCTQRFAKDAHKRFVTLANYDGQQADLSLSLDVIYHLVEDEVFDRYMRTLFAAARRFTVIYSSNTDTQRAIQGKHIRHRRFTDWIEANLPDWELLRHVPNRYPYNAIDDSGSFADFYIYQRRTPGP